VNKHKPYHDRAEHSPPDGVKPQAADEGAIPQAAAANAQAQATNKSAEPQPTAKCAMPEDSPQKLRAELAAAKDREMRAHAELDNYRKRAARELDERLRYANLSLLRDLLPVLDNVDRAIEAGEKSADAAALLEGFKIVSQQLGDVLKRHHCTRIEALHAEFDPNVHHAVMQQPSEEHPANTVLMVTQNGYQLHDRVVRPSQVIVSAPK
jgi:molecular chaperone GrpE